MTKHEEGIVKMLEACTSNVSQDTARGLDGRDYYGITVFEKGDYGWFVYVPSNILDDDYDHADIPEELYTIMVYAHKKGCSWIMFDLDVDPIEELTVFDW